MRLLLIRHAIAEDRETFAESGRPDADRPLTPRGKARMKRAARGLASLVPAVEVVATSPLRRAAQTALIVARRVAVGRAEVRDELIPEASPADALDWLRTRGASAEVIAVVGHEPHLGRLAGWLVAGRDRAPVVLKKGGACLIEVPARARPGTGRLLWSLTPAQLRALGR